jgi:hypothetical protein
MTVFNSRTCIRTLTLGLGLLTWATGANAQVTRDMLEACKGRATCAEADFYSGTFQWNEELTSSTGDGGDRSASSRKVNVSVLITSGRVECSGTIAEESRRWSSGRLEEDATRSGVIGGAGLIKIEFGTGGTHSVMGTDEDEEVELDSDAPSYNLTVVCPSPRMTSTGGGQTDITPSRPARWGSSEEFSTYHWLGDFDQPGLKGTSSWRHPDSDPANGVRGRVSVIWSLTKGPPPAAKP